MTSYRIIANPVSGRGIGHVRAQALAAELVRSDRVEVVETSARGTASDLAADAVGRVDRVVAVGGDGTLNEVLAGLMRGGERGREIPELAFLPAGTANVARRAFGLGTDPRIVAGLLPRAPVRPVDIGIARSETWERPFLLWCGAGYDAVVIDALNTGRTGPMGLRGLLANAPRVVGAITGYGAPEVDVVIDGSTAPTAASVVVANIGDVAFGVRLSGAADPFDGRLDVVTVPRRPMPVLQAMRMVISGLDRVAGARHATASTVSLRADGPVPVQLDGEPVGTLPVDVRVEPGAVRLLLTR